MSIVQELYTIFDKERSRYEAKRSSRNAVLRELAENLAFLREGLRENLAASKIVKGLEDKQFTRANDSGFNFDSIQKKTLSVSTCGGIKEFEKYKGWSTSKIIKNFYERLSTIRKLASNKSDMDAQSRLKYLFKFLMLIMAHIDGKKLKAKSR